MPDAHCQKAPYPWVKSYLGADKASRVKPTKWYVWHPGELWASVLLFSGISVSPCLENLVALSKLSALCTCGAALQNSGRRHGEKPEQSVSVVSAACWGRWFNISEQTWRTVQKCYRSSALG